MHALKFLKQNGFLVHRNSLSFVNKVYKVSTQNC